MAVTCKESTFLFFIVFDRRGGPLQILWGYVSRNLFFFPHFLLPCTWVWEKNMCTQMAYPPDPFISSDRFHSLNDIRYKLQSFT